MGPFDRNRLFLLCLPLIPLLSCSGNINNNSPVLWVTQLESTDSSENSSNADSHDPVITPDGRYIAFASEATNLLHGLGTSPFRQIYRKDTVTREIVLVSVNEDGSFANAHSDAPSISDDGRYVVFESRAKDIIAGFIDENDGETEGGIIPDPPTYNHPDVYLRDLATQQTILVSQRHNSSLVGSGPTNSDSHRPMISGDGRFVVFESSANKLTETNLPPPWSDDTHIFLRDLEQSLSATNPLLVDKNPSGDIGNNSSLNPAVSRTGRFVVFETLSSNLNSDGYQINIPQTGGELDILRWEKSPTQGGLPLEVRYLSRAFIETQSVYDDPTDSDCTNPSVSENGTVVFESDSVELDEHTATSPALVQIYLYEPSMGDEYEIISSNNLNSPGTKGDSTRGVISPNGLYVCFLSNTNNLSDLATGNSIQVYLRDRVESITRLSSVRSGGGSEGNGNQDAPSVTDTGKTIFASESTNLVQGDANFSRDIFTRGRDSAP